MCHVFHLVVGDDGTPLLNDLCSGNFRGLLLIVNGARVCACFDLVPPSACHHVSVGCCGHGGCRFYRFLSAFVKI